MCQQYEDNHLNCLHTAGTSDKTPDQQFPDSEQQLGSGVDAVNTRSVRTRTQTGNGQGEQIGMLRNTLLGVLGALTRQRDELYRLMLSSPSESLHLVKST